ncbi:pilus assembly protein N-terminal domain-containing protein [Archangium violaceum]|uniref:pilus assembly protein N-terminal domain-containing protein n=1 Tax=Archangium violaceum TaxID=83451 RepID=UPI00193AEC8F|nr:pilus assembly protein N-terminal domain-containing protein [Archangium violaceum]QRK10967.1 pilus assembly protein N-terminal domain-containing protein [Archangium violaceum]
MHVKKMLGGVAVLAVMVFGSTAGAAQAGPVRTNEAQAPAPEETLTLKAREVRTLEVKGLTRIAVGDPEIVGVTVEGGSGIRLTGLEKGETTMRVWTSDGARKAYKLVVQG